MAVIGNGRCAAAPTVSLIRSRKRTVRTMTLLCRRSKMDTTVNSGNEANVPHSRSSE